MSFQFVPKRKLLELEKILLQEEVILKSILSVITNDKEEDIGVALMNVFWSNAQDVAVMEKTCLPVELARTTEEAILFRQNSSYLFMLSEFLRLNGGDYMRKVLRPAFKHFLKKDTVHYEIDPKRIDSMENMTKHINNITGATQFFLDTILKAVHEMPPSLRDFIRRLHEMSEKRFPGSGYRSIGAIYFLRFVCPMIVSPAQSGLIKETKDIGPSAQRGLIMIAKVIQSIANESTSFEKEEYMKPLTELVMKHVPSVHTYYEVVLKEEIKPFKFGSRNSCPPPYLLMIVRFLRRDGDKVHAQMLELGGTEALWSKVLGLVDALSPKSGTSKPGAVPSEVATANPDGEQVAVANTPPGHASEMLGDETDVRSGSPPLRNLGQSNSSHALLTSPLSPKKGKKEKEKDDKDKDKDKDKKGKHKPGKMGTTTPPTTKKNDNAQAQGSLSDSTKPMMSRTNSALNAGTVSESSDSTEEPRSAHSEFAAP